MAPLAEPWRWAVPQAGPALLPMTLTYIVVSFVGAGQVEGMNTVLNRDQVAWVIRELTDYGGGPSADFFGLIHIKPSEVTKHKKSLAEIYSVMFRGFFHAAAKGIALGSLNRVEERFGRSIKDNYPEASEPFLKFATTYWTLRVNVIDLMKVDMDWVGAHLLRKLEQDIGPVFFPFPGAVTIDPSNRESFQRELIQESGADIDIDEFIKGNPILVRDRAVRRGCLGIFLKVLVITTTLGFIISLDSILN